ncbi:putative nuclease HARBI1 [Acyrthosiphon pisum]|uniref:DDE Tnp4 domain-containing protein n=1 Tax=Acyrthosiphon pisum TaxID=7029 RepID=A0A8R2NMD2_ACYPI|nr:putative nuclease HARBI1 [Acyrthosiphon pisum]
MATSNEIAALFILQCEDDDNNRSLFQKNFRLKKNATCALIEILAPHIEIHQRSSSISVEIKVLIALHFFATGSYQSPVGNSRFTEVSQSTTSRYINEVVSALNHPEIFGVWVHFPTNMPDLIHKSLFRSYRKTGFPGVIGCLDCAHIAIVPPSKNLNLDENQYPEHIYVNRDSGYTLRQWLLTPINNPSTEAKEYFNAKQMSTRIIIERCNGVMKSRFRCLLKDRTLHYKLEKATAIINACVVLPEYIDDIEDYDMGIYNVTAEENNNNQNKDLILGRQQRDKIVRFLHNRRVM